MRVNRTKCVIPLPVNGQITHNSIEEENKLRVENSRTVNRWKVLMGAGVEYVQFGVDNKAKILIPGAPGTAGTVKDIAFNSQLNLAKYSGFVRAYRNVMGNGTLSFAKHNKQKTIMAYWTIKKMSNSVD